MPDSSCFRPLLRILPLLLLAGCATPEPWQPPTPTLPDQWRHAPSLDPANPAHPIAAGPWWQSLGSPTLDALEQAALAHHPDRMAVLARLAQAEARLRVAESPLLPELELQSSQQRARRNSATPSAKATLVQTTQASLAASYELDYRGRNRALTDKAAAELDAAHLEHDSLLWSLTADLASGYVKLLTLKARRAQAEHARATATRTLELIRHQVAAGHGSPLDAARQENTVATIEAQSAALALQHDQTEAALALLADQPLAAMQHLEGHLETLRLPVIAPGLPATLLTRRPDIRRAEADLQAAHADLQAARAALFPTIQLTAERGYASNALGTLLSPASLFWNLSAGMVATLFDHGKTAGAIELAQGKRQAAVAAYQRAILSALKDVEENLAASHWLAEQEQAQRRAESAAQEALRLAEARHQAGASDFLAVLEAQRTLLQAQDERPQIRQARLNAAIGLFKALGGRMEERLPETLPTRP
ncbi:MAG: efflux transporter outer membrane subunit [Magnetococcales bacterium]|nr:efflux transporter outer membrane subunit [Magnetococcales bacterium]